MPVLPRMFASAQFAAVLLVIAGVTAADGPSRTDGYAPAESFTADQRAHWAYQPVKRVVPPVVKETGWVKNPIDRFILAELEALALPHAPEADRVALIRRATFDLTGLPPSPEEVAAFLNDQRPDAFERLVDRLLASPRYGERWGQHWLDLAHYADSNGFELDAERPDAWRYRDWVVKALNSDLPYDQFLSQQLAGDEIHPGDHQALIATGFCRCGPREVVGGNVIPEVKRQSELAEITGTVGSVFLGLTIGCARCHDHKFDAIPTTDYYRLQAFFARVGAVGSADRDQAGDRGVRGRRKVDQTESRAAQGTNGGARGTVPGCAQGEEDGHAHGRRARHREHAPEEPDVCAEAAGARDSRHLCESPGRRSPRQSRPIRPIESAAKDSNARSTKSNETCRGRRRTRWHWSTSSRALPKRTCYVAATTGARGRGSLLALPA